MWGLFAFYDRVVVEPGKQPLFLLLVAFVVTFLCIRLSVRMIRAQVSWWPGNISTGGTHVHHVVFGIGLMTVAGVSAFTPAAGNSPWWEILAMLFGVGAALVLDEFALVLHLDDVYWSEQGRVSVDAVVLVAAVTGLLVIGALPLGVDGLDDSDRAGLWNWVGWLSLNTLLVAITFVKGKFRLGVLGMLVPLLAVVGAVRLARPGSVWALRRYQPGSRRDQKSRARAERGAARWTTRKNRLFDLVAGRPDDPARPSGE